MTKVLANDHDATTATNNFALIANLLHARVHLHLSDSSLYGFTCNDK